MRLKVYANGNMRLSSFDGVVFHVAYWLVGPLRFFERYRPRPYDPSGLVRLAQEQFPDETWLHAALDRCTRASAGIPYIYFVDPRRANKPGAQWQFDTRITLEDPQKGELILDVLKDGRIGGIEFLGVLLGHKRARMGGAQRYPSLPA